MNWKLGFVICLVLGSCFLVISPVLAMGGPAPKKVEAPLAVAEKVFLIDNFESGSLKSPREWWTFDIEKAECASNGGLTLGDPAVLKTVGNFSLLLSGPAKSWYAGGCGTYLAKEGQDLAKYTNLAVDVYGNGPGSGTVKVELIDDDNSNWQAEQDPAKGYAPVYDDKFTYEIRVDWSGWKRVSLPLADFVDENPMVGDDIWNPYQLGASGGLLQMQLICIATSDKGTVKYNLDNIALAVE